MCGIVGIWGKERGIRTIRQATNILKHRGPDGESFYKTGATILGHRRLSIVDVDHAWQPLKNEDGSVAVIYNGEIYNHVGLRNDLDRFHSFETHGDGEVIPHLLEDLSISETASRLRGMFAIAAVRDGILHLARDPLGIKPLYWSRTDDRIVFGSEIKALLPITDPATIEEFPAGHVFSTNEGLKQYWDLPPKGSPSTDQTDDRLLAALKKAVEQRLMADVPVGLFLSGGLDSSIIAAIAVEFRPGIPSFAIGIEGSEDLAAARRVAAYLGTEHKEVILRREQVAFDLPHILHSLESHDVDLVASAIPTFYVSKLARKRVKVVLSGEGADEAFAGYDYLRRYRSGSGRLDEELRRLLRLMSSVNLQRVDRMSMAHGLEVRVPFLDLDVLRIAFSLPEEEKLTETQSKVCLRRIAERLLPKDIADRPKVVFAAGSGAEILLQSIFDAPLADIERHLRDTFYTLMPESIERLVKHWRSDRTEPASS